MPVTTPNVGVRAFFNPIDEATFVVADQSSIGGVFEPAADMDRSYFEPDTPKAFTTDDKAASAAAGTSGTLRQLIDACTAEGIIATVVASVPPAWAANITDDAKMASLVGSAAGKTGMYSLLEAEAETGIEPGILVGPGYTSQRPGNAANPLVTAIDAVCEALISPIGVWDTPSTTREDAAEAAADFGTSYNLVACAQGVMVSSGGLPVVRPASPSIAALIAKTDKANGAPYYNPGNNAFTGILGPSRSVSLRLSDPDCEANYLLQRGVNAIVQLPGNRTSRSSNSPQGKTFWGFFTTSTDVNWRAINVIRTRKAVRKTIPTALVPYIGKNMGVHVATLLGTAINDFLSELKSLPTPAILPSSSIAFDATLNDGPTLRAGGFIINLNFAEAPPILDLQLYTGSYPQAFTILASEIQQAMNQLGVQGTFAAADAA